MSFSRLTRLISKAGLTIAQCALLLLLLIISYAVVARYVLHSPSVHAVEISSYLLALMVWTAVAWTHIEDRHVGLEHFRKIKYRAMRLISGVVAELATLIFCLTLVYAGISSVLTAYDKNYRSASLLEFPQWPLLLLIPVGAAALGLVSISRLGALFSSTPVQAEK